MPFKRTARDSQTPRVLAPWAFAALTCIAALFAIGCDRHVNANNSNVSPAPVAQTVPGEGTVIGHVTFTGDPPKNNPDEMLQVEIDSLVVGANGALQNAVISVDGTPASDGQHQPPVVFDQMNMQFVPHVVAVQTGQPLAISNHDRCAHTVDMECAANPPRNLTFDGPDTQTVSLGSPEFFHVRCDIHPDMTAWIAVLPNPCFAVTGEDGSFVIHHVPAGAFTLSVWHERLGTMQQPLFMKPGETVKLNFVYKP
jgi:plastocyanin